MLFADLTGSTRLSALVRAEPERYAALTRNLLHIYRTVVARHGGIAVRIHGDGVLAMFGYPREGEDDARRATEAALELRDAVRALRVEPSLATLGPLKLHSGIHAGLVLVSDGADPSVGRFTLDGLATNIAGKLSQSARPDEVLVSAGTLGPDSGLFTIESQRTLQIDGAPDPIVGLSVAARAEGDNRFEARARRGLSPFVGREELLATLVAALDQASAGRARSLALLGTAGMGKTRLANQFLERCQASGIAVVRGYCESYLGAEPLQPFRQMLRVRSRRRFPASAPRTQRAAHGNNLPGVRPAGARRQPLCPRSCR